LRRARFALAWMLAAAGLVPCAPRAAEPASSSAKPAQATKPTETEAQIDAELIEFLGTVDSEDEDWIDFLTQTDIAKVAKRATPSSPAAKPASPPAEVKK